MDTASAHDGMKLLYVHQNFPGQYLHQLKHYRSIGAEIVFVTQTTGARMEGVRVVTYRPKREVRNEVHHYLKETEQGILNAQEVARAAVVLKRQGFVPDVMIGHNGWGEIWYLKDVYMDVPLLGYFEFFYRPSGADVGFDSSWPVQFDSVLRVRTKNIGNLMGLQAADAGQCATHWQRSLYPREYQPKINVVHEGIDTRTIRPDAGVAVIVDGIELRPGDEIVTYVARNLEPYRGFDVFMRSLPLVLRARPSVHILIVGGDDVSYGPRHESGRSYRSVLAEELKDQIDWRRVHFLGRLPHEIYLKILQISRVHIYLTYPFVLSWSLLEAMSAECLIVASRTTPVEEVVSNGVNGVLVDFFNIEEIADATINALAYPERYGSLRKQARATIVERYDLQRICLPAQASLVETLAN